MNHLFFYPSVRKISGKYFSVKFKKKGGEKRKKTVENFDYCAFGKIVDH